MKKRYLSILLCLAIVCSLFSMTALAEEAVTTAEPEKDIILIAPAPAALCEVGDYAVSALPCEKGSVSAEAAGDGTVLLTVTPDRGFTLETLSVRVADGSELVLEFAGTGVYSFTMPEANVTVAATFMEDNTMLNFCIDVTASDWYYDDVLFVYENGLMNGTSNIAFSPALKVNRAMAATVLYRLAGEPAFMNDNIFSDVEKGSYYEKAVIWAHGKGIIKGVDETTFAPDADVTREQLATILYRYAQYRGEGFTGAWMFLLDFTDAADISSWADEAMHWCVMNGIFKGDGNKCLNPQGTASRAEVAAVLHAFAKVMAEKENAVETIDYAGKYVNGNGDTVTITAAENGGYLAEVSIVRLAQFDGTATRMDDALEFVLTDPSEGEMTMTFYPAETAGSFELIVTGSTWSLLETDTIFSGFQADLG